MKAAHTLIGAALGAALAVGVATAALASPARDAATVAALRDAAARDEQMSVAPWIPCSNGQAAALDDATVAAQQKGVADMAARTYAPDEPTHAALVAHLQALVARYNARAVAGGDTLCEPSGGVDQVQVLSSSVDGTTAQVTIQAHEWNETIGRANGVPFHYRPEATIQRTDTLALVDGQWLVSGRGPVTFVRGGP